MIDIVISVVILILLFLGFVGCVVPVLPGPVLTFGGMLLGHFFASYMQFDSSVLWIAGSVAIGVQIIDQIVPIIGTKKFGGTKAGVRGSIIGLIVGVFILPTFIVIGPFGIVGILAGPFIGAYIGEKRSGQDSNQAMKAAIGSFLGFVAGTLMKFAVAIGITIVMIANISFN